MFRQGKERISYSQLLFLIIGFLLGSSLLISPSSGINQSQWIAVLLGFVEGSIFALIYGSLSQMFPEMSLVEICDEVWGPYLSKVISFSFLIYVFLLSTIVVTNFTDFTQQTILSQTPPIIYTLVEVGICTYAACLGIETISRCSALLVPTVVLLLLTEVVMLMPRYHAQNLLPILNVPLPTLLSSSFGEATFPFGEVVIFVMLSPHLGKIKFRKNILLGLAVGCILLIVKSINEIEVLGATNILFTYPAYSVAKLINIGDILTRLEITTAFSFLVLISFKITILIYTAMKMAQEISGIKCYQTLATPFWILISLIGIHNFHNTAENITFANDIYRFLALPFQVVIPLVTLLIAIFKKKQVRAN